MRNPRDYETKLGELRVQPTEYTIMISVPEQTLTLFRAGKNIATYKISTSEKGTGQIENTNQTPLGLHRVSAKIGESAPTGAIFKARENTGEICAPGSDCNEDLILTRILRLEGLEEGFNKGRDRRGQLVDSFKRYIYIHGTNHEEKLGTPASHGCIRMANADVIELFDKVPDGTLVWIA
jgi:L,D-transpeptidase-like protein